MAATSTNANAKLSTALASVISSEKQAEPKFLNVHLTQEMHETRLKKRIGKSGRLFYDTYSANQNMHSTPFVSLPQIRMWQDAIHSLYERVNPTPLHLKQGRK